MNDLPKIASGSWLRLFRDSFEAMPGRWLRSCSDGPQVRTQDAARSRNNPPDNAYDNPHDNLQDNPQDDSHDKIRNTGSSGERP